MDFERRNLGFVFVVFLIVALLHVLVLSALRENLRAKPTAARPKAAPLTIRMIPPDRLPVSAAPAEEEIPSTNAHSKQHAQRLRSQKAVGQTVKPIVEEHATGTAVVRQYPGAKTEPTSDANAHTTQTEGSNVDWQGDLRRLEPGRTTGYKKASPFDPSNVDTPSQAPAAPLTRAVSDAARGDCRNAHARHGLLALPMLMLGAVSDSGCKW